MEILKILLLGIIGVVFIYIMITQFTDAACFVFIIVMLLVAVIITGVLLDATIGAIVEGVYNKWHR